MSKYTETFDDIDITVLSEEGKDVARQYADRIKACASYDHPAQLKYWANELISFIDEEFDL